jgi:uncharacterized protein (DUF302 family)
MSQSETEQIDIVGKPQITSFTVEHVVVSSNRTYREVIGALEAQLGPPADWEILPQQLAARNLSWEEVMEFTLPLIGTSGFTTFVKMDQGSLLSLTGKTKHIAQYSIGNHMLGVQMIEDIPEVGLYAPPRLLVYEDYNGRAFVAYDRITSLVSQYHNEQVTSIAQLVDYRLDELASAITGSKF